jgi:hypothetical protein
MFSSCAVVKFGTPTNNSEVKKPEGLDWIPVYSVDPIFFMESYFLEVGVISSS